jgi:hypothetical protein
VEVKNPIADGLRKLDFDSVGHEYDTLPEMGRMKLSQKKTK